MPKKLSEVVSDLKSGAVAGPKWTTAQLLAVKHLGPALIGQEMYDAAQEAVHATGDGRFGPALLGIIPDAYKDQRTLKDNAA